MLTILNRRELLTVMTVQQLSQVRQKLDEAGIRHTVRTGGAVQSSRSRGVAGIRADYGCEYKVYVHKDDYERAVLTVGVIR